MKKLALILLLLSSKAAFGQGTSLPTIVSFPQIAIGGETDGQNYVTLLQIVNNNSAVTTGHLELFSNSGAPLAALFDRVGPQTSLDLTLAPGQSRQIQLSLDGALTAGWMRITYSPADALTTVVLQFRSGTTLLSEIGVQPADVIDAADLPVETDAGLNTGLALANPSTTAGAVLVTLWDSLTGMPVSYAAVSLPANAHVSVLLTELFPDVPKIAQMRAKLSLDSCSDASCNFAGGGFISTAVRLNGDQFTTIPVTEATTDGEQTRVLPQVAFGGPSDGLNMKTVLYFTTNVSTGVFGTAKIFDNDGNPLSASADGGAPSSAIPFTVLGNRVTRVVLSSDRALTSGWIHLELSGAVQLITNAIFQTFIGPDLVSEASVLESPAVSRGLIYVKTQPGLADVGVALANAQATPDTIELTLFDGKGAVFATHEVSLSPNGHLAQFVTEIFPELAAVPDFDGALSMLSSSEFSAMALRLSSDKIATLPVAINGMYRPSITALRITSVQRSPAQVNFAVDVSDSDSDTATDATTAVAGAALLDFGNLGYDVGPVSIDGRALLNRSSGTLTGSFVPPHITSGVPSGVSALFYILIFDAAGNQSNIIDMSVKF